MAFDEELGERVRAALGRIGSLTELRMFGGLCFTIAGNMAVGVVKDDLMVRMAPEDVENALSEDHVRPMDFTGRPMKGFVFVAAEGVRTDGDLERWVERGVAFASSLPAKKRKSRKAPGTERPAGNRGSRPS
jgi:TfoX/Sxy family transcriptional regulator of competence genes